MRKVLIVDDEEDLCLLMRSYLRTMGYDVYIAFTLQEGIRKLEEIKPDIIFLDNNLPDGIGWYSVGYIRRELPLCKINLMSAYQRPPRDFNSLNSVEFLEKPISLVSLKGYL